MIIGITGTFASGKDTVADYLEKKGFEHFSLSNEIRNVAAERGIEPTRDNMRELGNALREEFGPDYLPRRVLKRAKSEKTLVSSIRQPSEIDYLRNKKDFVLLGVDAPVELRFERMVKRGRSGDPDTLESFKEKEAKEMQTKGENVQKIGECMKVADHILINDGDFDKLYKEVDRVLSE